MAREISGKIFVIWNVRVRTHLQSRVAPYSPSLRATVRLEHPPCGGIAEIIKSTINRIFVKDTQQRYEGDYRWITVDPHDLAVLCPRFSRSYSVWHFAFYW